MGYQALLFCPDERTARTVTQVLSELEFNVESCIEPFAAVKKLMGQHFDAVVVDCDNEQNATLLFKSARNSTPNQASLAVAVVEGQAGVAKAFRIGANLVLTKPINIEQAKGTLRVARGLLRKGDPAKPAATPAAPAAPATPPKPVASKPVPPAKPAAPTTLAAANAQRQFASAAPPSKPLPTPAAPVPTHAAVASSLPVAPKPAAQDDDLLELDQKPAVPTPATTTLPSAAASVSHASGAASAPAPAREIPNPTPALAPDADILEKSETPEKTESPAEAHSTSSSHSGAEPSFTFGGANVEEKSSGASKKILFAVAAAALVSGAIYLGWTTLHGTGSQSTQTQPAPVAAAPVVKQPTQPAVAPSTAAPSSSTATPPTSPSASITQPASQPAASAPTNDAADDSADASDNKPAPDSKKPASTAASKPAAAPLVLKGGKVPSVTKATAAADAPAPSITDMGSTSSSAPPLDLGTSASSPAPVLGRINVSQGVSQGLLIKKVTPVYPHTALQVRVEGNVELLATISKTGDITQVKVLSGDQLLTKAATDAVKQWKYKPYLLNGEPVEIQTQVTVKFKLPN